MKTMNSAQYENLYYKSNTSIATEVLRIFFSDRDLPAAYSGDLKSRLPFKVHIKDQYGGYPRITGIGLGEVSITTAKRLESTILSLFTSTNYNNIKDIKNIKRGRYIINFETLNLVILQAAFEYILKHKNPRISKSWLAPIQERIIKGYEPLKFKRKRPKLEEEEEAPVLRTAGVKTRPWSGDAAAKVLIRPPKRRDSVTRKVESDDVQIKEVTGEEIKLLSKYEKMYQDQLLDYARIYGLEDARKARSTFRRKIRALQDKDELDTLRDIKKTAPVASIDSYWFNEDVTITPTTAAAAKAMEAQVESEVEKITIESFVTPEIPEELKQFANSDTHASQIYDHINDLSDVPLNSAWVHQNKYDPTLKTFYLKDEMGQLRIKNYYTELPE